MTDACEHCPQEAPRAVASRGPVPARVLLLSGAPRHHEEHDGVAFASPLFLWLEERLAAAGLDPADVHYATLIGCRPPHQRPMRDSDIAACAPRLDVTIAAVAPRVIVLCGPDAVAALLPGVSLSNAHGVVTRRGHRRYYPMRHPYAAPHSERYVDELMDDLRRLRALLDEEWTAEVEDEKDEKQEQMISAVPTMFAPTETAPVAQRAASHPQDDESDAPMDAADDAAPAENDPVEDDGVTQPDQEDQEDAPTQLSFF
jgi:uracil-DNA glycosylase family 4